MSAYGFDAWKQVDPALIIGNRIVLHRSQNGKRVSGLCPFHPDTDPSLKPWKFSDDGTSGYLCSTCGACGNIATFVMRYDHVSFLEARRRIMAESRAAIENGQPVPPTDYSNSTKIVTFPMSPATCSECRQRVVKPHTHYEGAMKSLETSLAGQDWLAKRGIGMEVARQFCIGFVQDGMCAAGDSHPWRLNGWLLFPFLSADRQTVTCVKYRSLVGKKAVIDGQKVVGVRCVSSPSMFNLPQVDVSGDVWICEGEPDCLVLAQAGLQAASIPSAAIAPSDEECSTLAKAKRLFLAGDNDGGVGTAAMIALQKRLPKGSTYVIKWPNGRKDANDVLTYEYGNDPATFALLLEQLKGQKS